MASNGRSAEDDIARPDFNPLWTALLATTLVLSVIVGATAACCKKDRPCKKHRKREGAGVRAKSGGHAAASSKRHRRSSSKKRVEGDKTKRRKSKSKREEETAGCSSCCGGKKKAKAKSGKKRKQIAPKTKFPMGPRHEIRTIPTESTVSFGTEGTPSPTPPEFDVARPTPIAISAPRPTTVGVQADIDLEGTDDYWKAKVKEAPSLEMQSWGTSKKDDIPSYRFPTRACDSDQQMPSLTFMSPPRDEISPQGSTPDTDELVSQEVSIDAGFVEPATALRSYSAIPYVDDEEKPATIRGGDDPKAKRLRHHRRNPRGKSVRLIKEPIPVSPLSRQSRRSRRSDSIRKLKQRINPSGKKPEGASIAADMPDT